MRQPSQRDSLPGPSCIARAILPCRSSTCTAGMGSCFLLADRKKQGHTSPHQWGWRVSGDWYTRDHHHSRHSRRLCACLIHLHHSLHTQHTACIGFQIHSRAQSQQFVKVVHEFVCWCIRTWWAGKRYGREHLQVLVRRCALACMVFLNIYIWAGTAAAAGGMVCACHLWKTQDSGLRTRANSETIPL